MSLTLVLGFVLGLSLLTFVVLFGRLPALRNTPIGLLHRTLLRTLPNGVLALDRRLCGGRLRTRLKRAADYLMNENHPLVLIFFVSLMAVAELLFLPAAWPDMHPRDKLGGLLAAAAPYLLLRRCIAADPAITRATHARALARYPYDRILYHPNQQCGACGLLKPPRSRHCALCGVCVARHDHHCIWLRRCVGGANLRWFLALLLALGVLAVYAVFVGWYVLSGRLQEMFDRLRVQGGAAAIVPPGDQPWWRGSDLATNAQRFSAAIGADVRVGGVFLLALLCWPLPFGLLAFHGYLVWAGATTSETAKWALWRQLVRDGLVFRAAKSAVYAPLPRSVQPPEEEMRWPVRSEQTLRCVDGGAQPRVGYEYNDARWEIRQPADPHAPPDLRWSRVGSMREVVNLYDMGFWRNLRDALGWDVRGK